MWIDWSHQEHNENIKNETQIYANQVFYIVIVKIIQKQVIFDACTW